MGLFGRKDNDKDDNLLQNSEIAEEMKVILEAREEVQQEKEEKIREREEAAAREKAEAEAIEAKAAFGAEQVLALDKKGDNFFLVIDEVPQVEPDNAGAIVFGGMLRGKLKKGDEVYVLHGHGDVHKLEVLQIRNDQHTILDEAENERVEIEVSKGDLPLPGTPDEEAARPIGRYAVLTRKAPKTLKHGDQEAYLENPRFLAMMAEYVRFHGDQEYFGSMMAVAIDSSFLVPANISVDPKDPAKKRIGFPGMKDKNDPEKILLPVYTDANALSKGNFKALNNDKQTALNLSFAKIAAIAKDDRHAGFVVNPHGPVVFTFPKNLVESLCLTGQFSEKYGEDAADKSGFESLGSAPAVTTPMPKGPKKMIVSKPQETGEFKLLAQAVRNYGDTHPEIAKIAILMSTNSEDPKDKAYVCIVDCPEENAEKICRDMGRVCKPYMKTVRAMRFQLFSKGKFPDSFTSSNPWTYNKLSL
ncbi:MAG: SseB family protein [Clostridiales bacterium]|nr:SseB family protein [Clostridiales bacterium]